jgi:hypothetical protein
LNCNNIRSESPCFVGVASSGMQGTHRGGIACEDLCTHSGSAGWHVIAPWYSVQKLSGPHVGHSETQPLLVVNFPGTSGGTHQSEPPFPFRIPIHSLSSQLSPRLFVCACTFAQFTKVQRITVLAAVLLTSMAVVAAFYGQNSQDFRSAVMTTLLGGLLMTPCRWVFPRLFRAANSHPSLPRWPRQFLDSVAASVILGARRVSQQYRKRRFGTGGYGGLEAKAAIPEVKSFHEEGFKLFSGTNLEPEAKQRTTFKPHATRQTSASEGAGLDTVVLPGHSREPLKGEDVRDATYTEDSQERTLNTVRL